MSEGVSRNLRLAHKWAAIAVCVPLLIVIATGIFLQVRKPVDWIQPNSERGSATFQPRLTQDQILEAVRGVPRMEVNGWNDLLLTDYRPRKGIIKVRTPGQLETQVDAATGAVLKTGQRWNDIVMKIHDGSAFGGRLWLFLPAGIGALFLSLSGIYLGFIASARRWRRHRSKRRRANRAVGMVRKPLNLTQFCFKYHYWAALVVTIPWLVVITAGLMLQLRYEIPGVMPEHKQGISTVPVLEYQQVLDVAKTIPQLRVEGWSDIWRIYTYPAKGIMEIRTKIGYGAQLDATTGKILDVYSRSADFWEDVHEGIFGRHQLNGVKVFGDNKINLSMWVFLPVNIIALFLWFSGVVVALRTTVRKAASVPEPAPTPAVAVLAAAGSSRALALPGGAAAPQPDDRDGYVRLREREDADLDQGRQAARLLAQRRRAAAMRVLRRHADLVDAGTRASGQVSAGKGARQTRRGWRRRTG
jgi:uncharacterized iron-regulated membrane protein